MPSSRATSVLFHIPEMLEAMMIFARGLDGRHYARVMSARRRPQRHELAQSRAAGFEAAPRAMEHDSRSAYFDDAFMFIAI